MTVQPHQKLHSTSLSHKQKRNFTIAGSVFVAMGIAILLPTSIFIIPNYLVLNIWLRLSLTTLAYFALLFGVSLLLLCGNIDMRSLRKDRPSLRQIVVIIGSCLLVVCFLVEILGLFKANIGVWSGIPAIVSSTLGVLCSVIGLQEPSSPSPAKNSTPPLAATSSSLEEFEPVTKSDQSQPHEVGTIYRDLRAIPFLTDEDSMQRREKLVQDIYERLVGTKKVVTIMALTSLSEIGKTTVAALVYRYAKKQREAGKSPFDTIESWLSIDRNVTMIQLADTLFKLQDISMPKLYSMSLNQQAIALCEALNAPEKARLIVLDQFDHLWGKPGIEEWIKVLATQKCACRILLTCRSIPPECTEYTLPYWRELEIPKLEVAEGIELLRAWGVEAGIGHLRMAVEQCECHPAALRKVAHIYRQNPSRNIIEHVNDLMNKQLAISPEILERVQQLEPEQFALLRAFSIYRGDTVSWSAVMAQIKMRTEDEKKRLNAALEVLIRQDLVEDVKDYRYRVHDPVASAMQTYSLSQIRKNKAKRRTLLQAHRKAAQYYLQEARSKGQLRIHTRQPREINLLLEAVWHLCKAQRWKEAYTLMQREDIFVHLQTHKKVDVILQYCQMFLRTNTKFPNKKQAEFIYKLQEDVYNSNELENG